MKLISIAGTTAAAKDQLAAGWQLGRAADYAAWQADKAAGTPTSFTDAWLTDRATVLQAVVARNQQNNQTQEVLDARATAGQVTFFHYTDPATGSDTILSTRNSGVSRLPDQHLMFGDDKNNAMNGYDNARGDHLYGGAGNDRMGRQTNGGPVFAANAGEGITRTEPFDIKNVASCRSTAMAGRRFDATPANNAHRRSATWVA